MAEEQILPHLFRFEDTCNVYALCSGEEAVLVDFGDGSVLSRLRELGIRRVTDVLMTHHHRDQGQGLAAAVAAGARVWAPQAEQDLFEAVDLHWQERQLYINYDVRQDRFSLLEPIPIAGTLHDYARHCAGPFTFTVIPTPGHTPGSISLMVEVDGQKVCFSGDLIAAHGKVWSLSATQWTYNGAEGVAASIASLADLKQRAPQILLPSHGEPIVEPGGAIDLLVERLGRLLNYRCENPRLFQWLERPYLPVTPHLLRNQTSMANSYVLLSESGKALVIDYGYDFMTGAAPGSGRAARRPWLYSLPALKRDFGVEKVEVAIPTHFHDDHVAGLNLLREVEGTQVWAAASFAPVLENPASYDLPCLWYDPIPVDRALPLEQPFTWQEYELAVYALPGHTAYAAAIAFQVDGLRVLATGDQYSDKGNYHWNYVYQNRFQAGDYRLSAELYRRICPELILSGHWDPYWVQPGYFDYLQEGGELLERLHQELLPAEGTGLVDGGFYARIQPYQAQARAGETFCLQVEVRNPYAYLEEAVVRLLAPAGWQVDAGRPGQGAQRSVSLGPSASRILQFQVTPPPGLKARRVRLAADLTVGQRRLGSQAEALVSVV